MSKKTATGVDADGLRTHCPDGHRLWWPALRREAAHQLREKAAALPTPEYWHDPRRQTFTGAVCRMGQVWEQQRARVTNKHEIDLCFRYRNSARPTPDPIWTVPVLKEQTGQWVQGNGPGRASLEVEYAPDQPPRTRGWLACANLKDYGSFSEEGDGFLLAHPVPPPLPNDITPEAFLALCADLTRQGWVVGRYKTLCPVCFQTRDHAYARRDAAIAAAAALDAEDGATFAEIGQSLIGLEW